MQSRVSGVKHVWLLLAVVFVAAATLPEAASATVWDNSQRAYSFGRCYSSSASYNAVKAEMEVHAGIVSASDLQGTVVNGLRYRGFILEAIWCGDLGAVSWVEVGYIRGWNGSDEMTPYWACNTVNDNFFKHKVTSVSLAVEDTPVFKIVKVSGVDQAWRCYIKGEPAQDPDGDATANSSIGNTFNSYDVGLESNCTSGRLGTSTDWINCNTIQKSWSGGDTWSFGPPYDFVVTDPGSPPPETYGWWKSAPPGHNPTGSDGQLLWNYRNDNPY